MISMTMTRRPKLNLIHDPGVTVFRTIGTEIKRFMIARTKSGRDVSGRDFAGYAERTIEFRAKKGKVTDYVNLEYLGQMHQSMQVKPTAKYVDINYGDRDRATVALKHQMGGWHLPQREHFGLSDNDAKRFVAKLQAVIMKRIQAEAK